MKYILVSFVALAIICFYRFLMGGHLRSLFKRDPRAAMLDVAKTWFEAQPSLDLRKTQECWSRLSAILGRPEVVAQYVALVAANGKVTANNLTKSFSQLVWQMQDELSPELEKCTTQR